MKNDLTFVNITAERGKKAHGFTTVTPEIQIPVTVINGRQDGPLLLITAGIHGGEYPCIETATKLAKEIDPAKINGGVVIINCVNTAAFYARVSYISPLDGKNINRLFPGDPNGTAGDKLAYFLTENYQKRADFYLDLHGGDLHEKLPPYVYRPGVGDETVLQKSYDRARYINAKYMVKSKSTTGAYNSRAILGLPCLLIERGGMGLWSEKEVADYKEDVYNIMAYLGITDKEPVLPKTPRKEMTDVIYLDADVDGMWHCEFDTEEEIKQGQRLGYITDIFGNVIKEYFAEIDGTVLYIATSLAITAGTAIFTYGK